MGFQKYTKGEQLDLFTDAQNEAVNRQLSKTGKKSYVDLTDDEKAALTQEITDLNIDH